MLVTIVQWGSKNAWQYYSQHHCQMLYHGITKDSLSATLTAEVVSVLSPFPDVNVFCTKHSNMKTLCNSLCPSGEHILTTTHQVGEYIKKNILQPWKFTNNISQLALEEINCKFINIIIFFFIDNKDNRKNNDEDCDGRMSLQVVERVDLLVCKRYR